MASANCPECEGEVTFDSDVMKGEIAQCPDCGVELEVTGTKPLKLEPAPEEEEEREVEFHPYRKQEAQKQCGRLDKIRSERDQAAVDRTLAALRKAAEAGDNVMPTTMDAVEAYATVGEVCAVFREVFGAYEEPVRF